jgi:hypothetical protein
MSDHYFDNIEVKRQEWENRWIQHLDHDKIMNENYQEDNVNKPKHYNQGKLEVIEIIEDQKLDYHLGNVVKYVLRSRYKGKELEDLKKARWYLSRKIENLEKENEPPF